MQNTPQDEEIDLQEVNSRNQIARDIVTGFSTAAPTLTEIWRQLHSALAETPTLSADISRLRAELDATRLDCANLAAAARATIAAHHDGEDDPLSYIRDEIHAQGYSGGRRD